MLPQHVACHCPSLAEGTHSHAISDCWTFQVPSVSQLLGSLSGSGVQHPNVSGNTLKTSGACQNPGANAAQYNWL